MQPFHDYFYCMSSHGFYCLSLFCLSFQKSSLLFENLTTSYSWPWETFVCNQSPASDRLVGLVVKVSASRAEDPGFESRLRQDFSAVESY